MAPTSTSPGSSGGFLTSLFITVSLRHGEVRELKKLIPVFSVAPCLRGEKAIA